MSKVTVNPAVFRTQGIRGVYPDDFDADFLHILGARLAGYYGGTIVAGHAGIISSAHALIPAGAVQGGAQVIDIGDVSRPQCMWALRSLKASCGILCSEKGIQVFVRQDNAIQMLGGDHLRQIFDTDQGARVAGSYERHDIVDGYTAAIAYAAGWHGGQELRLAIDAPVSVQRVLQRLGPIAPDPSLAARFDKEGNVALYIDGIVVPTDHMQLILAESGRESVCVSPCISRIMRERINEGGIEHHIQSPSCDHALFPELTLLRVWQACNGDSIQLKEMLEPYGSYARKDISVPVRDQKHVDQIHAVLAAGFDHISRQAHCLTGDSWDSDDVWLHSHVSPSDSMLHLTVEAKQNDLLEQVLAEVRGAIS